jgi:hypothetical protein
MLQHLMSLMILFVSFVRRGENRQRKTFGLPLPVFTPSHKFGMQVPGLGIGIIEWCGSSRTNSSGISSGRGCRIRKECI